MDCHFARRIFAALPAIVLIVAVWPEILFMTEVPGWPSGTSLKIRDYVNPDKRTTLVDPTHNVSTASAQVLVVVHSRPDNRAARDVIRNTWKITAEHRGRLRVVFLTGNAMVTPDGTMNVMEADLRTEAGIFSDMVIVDLFESFPNLTLKSVHMLKYLAETGPSPTHYLKTDDDVFINVPYFIRKFDEATAGNTMAKGAIMGRAAYNKRPLRWVPSFSWYRKYYCSCLVCPQDGFPVYIEGAGYLFHTSHINCLFTMALESKFMPLEDVFVTGILREMCTLDYKDIPNFMTDKVLDWWWEFTRAIDQGNFAIAHHVQAAEIVELHKRFF